MSNDPNTNPAPVIDQGGHYRQDGYACEECGYSAFHYAYEFADGVEGDLTRHCADCGHIDTQTAEQYRPLRLAAQRKAQADLETARRRSVDPDAPAAEPYRMPTEEEIRQSAREGLDFGPTEPSESDDPREFSMSAPADGITAEIGSTGLMQTLAIDGRASVDIAAAVGAEHGDACDDASCDISRALEDGFPFWAADLLQGATETPLLDAVISHYCSAGMDWRIVSDLDLDEWLKTDTWTRHAFKCQACASITFGDDNWRPDTCANCLVDLIPIALDGYDVDGFITGYVEALLWANCLPYDPRPRIEELRAEIEDLRAHSGRDPQRQLCELADLAEMLDEGGEPLSLQNPAGITLSISDETRAELSEDCRDFIAGSRADLDAYAEQVGTWHGSDSVRGSDASYSAPEQAGHDFALTRNGHGAGFWDRGLGDLGRRLTDAAKPYGEVHLIDRGDGTAETF